MLINVHPLRLAMFGAICSMLLLSGCQTMKERVLDSSADGQTSVQLRSMQRR